MSYANCHLIELSVKVHPDKFKNALFRDDDDCIFTDVTHKPRFQVVKRAKMCRHCDRIDHDCNNR